MTRGKDRVAYGNQERFDAVEEYFKGDEGPKDGLW